MASRPTITQVGPTQALIKTPAQRKKDNEHKKMLVIGIGVVSVMVAVAVGLVLGLVVFKKPYKGGKGSKGSTRVMMLAARLPTAAFSDTTAASALKDMATVMETQLRANLGKVKVWVYPAALSELVWTADNSSDVVTNVIVAENSVCAAATFADGTTASNVSSWSIVAKKAVGNSTSVPKNGAFVVETDATAAQLIVAAAAVTAASIKAVGTDTTVPSKLQLTIAGTTVESAPTADVAKAVCVA
jgi:hypothetical protein